MMELGHKNYNVAYQAFCDACEAAEKGDVPKAVRLHKKAAMLGFSSSSANLGNLYSDLTPPDERKAVHWYKLAVKQGESLGAWNLSVYYRQRNNERWCLHWLRKAAQMGDEDAIAELRKLHRKR